MSRNYFLNEQDHYLNEIKHFLHVTEETWFLNSEEEKQRCSLVPQSAGAHLCSWAISWLRSSSSLLPVSSADPVELLLSWGERHRRCEKMEAKSTVQQGRKRRIRDDNGGKVRTINEEKKGIQQQEGDTTTNYLKDEGLKEGDKGGVGKRIYPLTWLSKQKTQEGKSETSQI